MKRRFFVLLACVGLAFSAFACHDESSSGGNNGSCKNGDKKCTDDGKGVISCGTDLHWEDAAKLCDGGFVCDPDRNATCVPCLLDAFKCSDSKDGYFVCGEDGWGTVNPCEEDLVCNETLKRCAEESCSGSERRCSPNHDAVETCTSGHWSSTPCDKDNHEVCEGEGNCVKQTECTPNVDFCSGTQEDAAIYHCTEAGERGTLVKTCPKGCNDDHSDCFVETCDTEDELRCSSDLLESQICKDGKWITKEFCPDTSLCDENECKKTVCKPNTPFCVNAGKSTGMYTCTPSGQRGALIDFCAACNEDFTACTEPCEEKDTKCSEDLLEAFVCKGGMWVRNEFCADTQLCDDGQCKETVCRPGTIVCTGTGRSAGTHECTNSGQINPEYIDYCSAFGCHNKGIFCNECEPGTVDCTEAGVFRICSSGIWVDMTDCRSKANCSTDEGSLGCRCTTSGGMLPVEPERRCNEAHTVLEVCATHTLDGITFKEWEIEQSCGVDGVCEDLSKTPYCKCTGDAMSCNGQVLQQCKNGVLTDVKQCLSQEICDTSKNDCVCFDNAARCDGLDRLVCTSGKWEKQNTCGKSQKCNESLGGVCVADSGAICKTGQETACNGNVLMSCIDAVFEPIETCSSFCAYNEKGVASCSSKCVPDTLFCSEDGTAIRKCNEDAVTTEDKVCPEGNRCVMDGKNAECKPKACDEGTFSCEGNSVTMCLHNEIIKVTNCEESKMRCLYGKCALID